MASSAAGAPATTTSAEGLVPSAATSRRSRGTSRLSASTSTCTGTIMHQLPWATGQALVVGLSWYQGRAYVALNADRYGPPDVQQLAEAIQPAAKGLSSLNE